MKKFAIAAALCAALSSCAGGGLFTKASESAGKQLCGDGYADADARNSRALCLGAAAVVVAELGADRVTRYEPDDAPYVAGLIENMAGQLNRIRSRVSTHYFNAEAYDVDRLILLSAERAARRTVDLSDFIGPAIGTATGVAVGGPIGAAGAAATAVTASDKFLGFIDSPKTRIAAAYALKYSALKTDTREFMAKVRSGEMTVDEGWVVIVDRLGYNKQRVAALVNGQ